MKKHDMLVIVILLTFLLLFESCKEESEEIEVVDLTSKIAFTLSDGSSPFQSDFQSLNGYFGIPVFEDSVSQIANYIRMYTFSNGNETVKDISIQLIYTVDFMEGRASIDSVLRAQARANNAKFLIDQMELSGFDVVVDLTMMNRSDWRSDQSTIENIDQRDAVFDIYEILESDTATYIKARFNCNLYNDFGEQMQLEGGNLFVRLD